MKSTIWNFLCFMVIACLFSTSLIIQNIDETADELMSMACIEQINSLFPIAMADSVPCDPRSYIGNEDMHYGDCWIEEIENCIVCVAQPLEQD